MRASLATDQLARHDMTAMHLLLFAIFSRLQNFARGNSACSPLTMGQQDPELSMGSALVFASGTGSQTGVSDVERKAGSSSSSSLHTFGVHVV